jgi:Tol biopolymer transport system component
MLRRPASRVPAVIALLTLGLFAGLALAALLSLPRLTAVSPAAGAQDVSSRAPIRLTFNRPMQPASVEEALRIAPALPGMFTWEGSTLIFTPGQPWPREGQVTVTLEGGLARSQRGLPLLGGQTWSFTIGGERLAYLMGEVSNLWVLPLVADAPPRQVTAEPFGVYDFGLSPDGVRFVYAALREDGGADLRLTNTDGSGTEDLLACPGEACLSPVFAPDGKRVAYERRTLVAGLTGEVTFGAAHVHVYDLAGGGDQSLDAGETARQTRFPRWGPDGRLSYYDTARQALVVHDLASGAVTYIPSTSGESGTWSPDGQHIVYAEIFFPPESPTDPLNPEEEHRDRFYSHLLRVTIATNATENLSGPGVVEDASPVYAPSGEWLAFARKGLAPDQWTPGRQLWLMRADGSDAHPLTADPLYHHSAFAWSPEGTAIAYMRFNAVDPSTPAEIWTTDVGDGSRARRWVSGGYLPAWLP